MIAMFVREKDAIELLRRDTAMLQTQDQLPRAQPAIDKNLAMISCTQTETMRMTKHE